MAGLLLRIEGEPKSITMSAFLIAVNNWVKVLADLDSGISGYPKGSLEWVVTDLATGSLQVAVASRSKLEDVDFGTEVERAQIVGLRLLENEGLTPPYMTEAGIQSAKRMLKLIGNQGVTGLRIVNPSDKEEVQLSARASAHIDQLLPVRQHSIGSVEGKLEMISVHGSKPQFLVYHHRTHKAVRCIFEEGMLDEVKDALGHRVIASGEVLLNAKDEPVRLKLERLRRLRSENELPSIAMITGIDPNFTGDLTTSDYLRSIRGN
jgi:hypothetical protein